MNMYIESLYDILQILEKLIFPPRSIIELNATLKLKWRFCLSL